MRTDALGLESVLEAAAEDEADIGIEYGARWS
jgi:hypothetical protein